MVRDTSEQVVGLSWLASGHLVFGVIWWAVVPLNERCLWWELEESWMGQQYSGTYPHTPELEQHCLWSGLPWQLTHHHHWPILIAPLRKTPGGGVGGKETLRVQTHWINWVNSQLTSSGSPWSPHSDGQLPEP